MSRRIKPGDVVLFNRGSMAGQRATVMVLKAEFNSRSGKSQVTTTLWPYAGEWFDHDLETLSMWAIFSDPEGPIDPELWGSEP